MHTHMHLHIHVHIQTHTPMLHLHMLHVRRTGRLAARGRIARQPISELEAHDAARVS